MLSIAIYGEKILNQQAEPVTVFDNQLHTLADDMLATMQQAHGVGIAAPQVHRSLQMFIMASNPNSRYSDAPMMAPQVVINPQILQTSVEQIRGEEGCLSLPQERCQVARFESIEVRYQDISGEWCQEWLSGFVARIFQHEFDHLQGITLRERMSEQA
ncbi:peptide deformylase [Shewanella mangrovi]|uniref:Peptide deformylase n=1 Tax=Shewanella mangrovi TaxID=1515746 RepID=A0A094JH83_9GAMM|nr:peptide deformylase [Shewanella mangrovi]KFZ37374.1 peptide deformylase [Shewanella mangrovi]